MLSPAEGAAALRDAGLVLDDAAADALVERTEGWAAGIYLAALAVRGLADAEEAAARFSGDHRLVAEYLRDELLDGLPGGHGRVPDPDLRAGVPRRDGL